MLLSKGILRLRKSLNELKGALFPVTFDFLGDGITSRDI